MSYEKVSTSINQILETVNPWLNVNKTKVNNQKSHFLVFSYREKILLSPNRMGTESIAQTERIKFLGVNLDENLSFKAHIDEICAKLSRTVGILFKLK